MLTITVTTIEREVAKITDATQITLPTIEGEITILPNHIPLMSVLGLGEVVIKKSDGSVQNLFVDGGIIQVNGSSIELLANMAERAEDIDAAKVEEAKRRAEKLLQEKPIDIDIAQVEASLQRELIRLNVTKKLGKLSPQS